MCFFTGVLFTNTWHFTTCASNDSGSVLQYAVCLNINPVPMGRDFVPLSVGLFKSTTLYAHIKLRVRWNRGSRVFSGRGRSLLC